MKITMITQYYKPEMGAPQNRLYEMCTGLKKLGVDISVITGMPNYPTGKIFDEYKKKVDAGEAFGIIGDAERLTDTFDTKLSEISHRVTEINYDELTSKVFGKIQLYDTPRGNIAQKLVDTYGSLDIAPSSFGEIEDGKVWTLE